MPTLVDTHCHIHEASYPLDTTDVMERARAAGVTHMVCVGTNIASSHEAIQFAASRDNVYATIGVHPHDASIGVGPIRDMVSKAKVVAIGEVGLDYFYTHSPRDVQIRALEEQLQVAVDYNLPAVFHVRDAFEDFWPVVDNFSHLKGGVLHSFTGAEADMKRGISRGFYIGINGISTFTKDIVQQRMFDAIPLEKIVLETDAPFLTPVPFRGKVNEPSMVSEVGQFHAAKRELSYSELARRTTANAVQLFGIAYA